MQDQVRSAVREGATVLTASRRLARVLTQEFNCSQRGGKSVWKTPDILPLEAFLRRCWTEWIVSGDGSAGQVLLGPAQEQALWEQIIRESPEGESLLRIPETARAAAQAWSLAIAYRLPLDGQFEASDDCAAFLRWAHEFQRRCDARRWLVKAILADTIGALIVDGRIARPSRCFLAGFDELTPQQAEFVNRFSAWEHFPQEKFESEPGCLLFDDGRREMERAARWARDLLDRNPAVRIGIIAPNLTADRAQVERVFRHVLHPGTQFEDRERAFHLSLGRPLSDYPIIHAALELLEFAAAPATLPRAGVLLRSPFLGGAAQEQSKRATLDALLRRRGIWNVSIDSLCAESSDCPDLQHRLGCARNELDKIAINQFASQWSRAFSKLLSAFGWPGDRALNSSEHQTIQAWQRSLSEFATLDAILPAIGFQSALERLRELAASTLFQVENEGAPVQIMGELEASGLHFDHLWIAGLHDQAFPASIRPNPFLPLGMQRRHRLPHASAERELEFAGAQLKRLIASAPDVVLSCPAQHGESKLEPSPLIERDRWVRFAEAHRTPDWTDSMRAAAMLETLADEAGPPLTDQSGQSGGTGLFRDMAACPFRAFVQHRIRARPLDDAELGLAAREKGMLVHKALELIWNELGSQQALCALTHDQLASLVSSSVAAALGRKNGGLGRSLERRRLQTLLVEWLEIEKTRPPFTVLQPEAARIVRAGGVAVKTRIDRIDELPDGRLIILDYKTGEVGLGGWDGARPADPQVPLYCATSQEPLAGAAFAQIRSGDMGFRGVDESGSLPNLKSMRFESRRRLAQQVEEWKRVLNALGERFRAGTAEVTPNTGECQYCGLTSLCRIRELEND
jgi:ATP-dependent helicase/nuclease subunit B